MAKGLFQRFENDGYIMKSPMDIDFYKFTMGQVIFHKYRDVPVKFAFKNRTKGVKIGDLIEEEKLRRELDHARKLRFNKTNLHYLRGTDEYGDRMFKEDYLDFLEELQLPPYDLEMKGGDVKLEFSGKWPEVTNWETISLSIVNELHNRGRMKDMSNLEKDNVYATGVQRLAEKVNVLKSRPDITFTDFGTRRRFSRNWQDYVVKKLHEELPKEQFLGTSNTYLAMKHGILPMGTCAHEMDMAMSGIMHGSDDDIRKSHQRVIQDWWDEYNWGLSIALTDTYGTDFFYNDMTQQQAKNWKGLRQDSGDPFKFIKKTEDFYDRCGINPKDKLIVFSDGLDINTITKLADTPTRFRKTYGWGTNLTNDLGLRPLSLVVKLVESNGYGTVKLSDNIAKAIGKPEDVDRFKRIFGYGVHEYTETTY